MEKRLAHLVATYVHAHAVGLHDSRSPVAVYNQPRQVVALAVNQPVGIVIGIVGYADGYAHLQGRLQPALPERGINGHLSERQDAHCDGAYLVMAHR